TFPGDLGAVRPAGAATSSPVSTTTASGIASRAPDRAALDVRIVHLPRRTATGGGRPSEREPPPLRPGEALLFWSVWRCGLSAAAYAAPTAANAFSRPWPYTLLFAAVPPQDRSLLSVAVVSRMVRIPLMSPRKAG